MKYEKPYIEISIVEGIETLVEVSMQDEFDDPWSLREDQSSEENLY